MTPYPARGSRKTVFIGFLLTACILLLMPPNVTSKLHFAFVDTLGGPLHLGQVLSLSAQQPASSDMVSVQQYQKLKNQVRQLQNQIANLQGWLQTERENVAQLQGLRTQPALKGLVLVKATPLAASGPDRITINRGSRDGIKPEQYALCDNAVIGRVTQTSSHRSLIELISSRHSQIRVHVGHLQKPVMLTGRGEGRVKIDFAQYDYPIKVGDPIYVNPNDALAQGIIVGRVKTCRRDEQHALLWDIDVTPAANLNTLRGLAVAIPQGLLPTD